MNEVFKNNVDISIAALEKDMLNHLQLVKSARRDNDTHLAIRATRNYNEIRVILYDRLSALNDVLSDKIDSSEDKNDYHTAGNLKKDREVVQKKLDSIKDPLKIYT